MFTSFSDISDAINTTFLFMLVTSVVMLTLITVLMIVFVVRYGRKRNPVPSQIESHTLLEITWTVIPTILVLVMFYFGWIGYRLIKSPPEGALEVTVIGRMWSWVFEYENGKQSDIMYVPVGRPVKANLKSMDVIHSFYIPAFKVKQDLVPGMDNFLWFNPVDTGSFDVFCAEYCGQRHSYMLSKVVVMAADAFDQWVNEAPPGVAAAGAEGEADQSRIERIRALGSQLYKVKGCNVCHSVDGSPSVGPSLKGIFGKDVTVVTGGKPRTVSVDDAYIRRSIVDPNADLVEGFQPLMPPQQGFVTEDEIVAITEYIKSLK